ADFESKASEPGILPEITHDALGCLRIGKLSIVVDENTNLAVGAGCAAVASTRHAMVGPKHNQIRLGKLLANDRRAAVGGTVVNYDDLFERVVLRAHRIQTAKDLFRPFLRSDHITDEQFVHWTNRWGRLRSRLPRTGRSHTASGDPSSRGGTGTSSKLNTVGAMSRTFASGSRRPAGIPRPKVHRRDSVV